MYAEKSSSDFCPSVCLVEQSVHFFCAYFLFNSEQWGDPVGWRGLKSHSLLCVVDIAVHRLSFSECLSTKCADSCRLLFSAGWFKNMKLILGGCHSKISPKMAKSDAYIKKIIHHFCRTVLSTLYSLFWVVTVGEAQVLLIALAVALFHSSLLIQAVSHVWRWARSTVTGPCTRSR